MAFNSLRSSWAGKTPSYEQELSARHIVSFMVDPDNGFIKSTRKIQSGAKYNANDSVNQTLLNNAINIRGYNGTGKSSVVVGLALEIYKKLINKQDGLRILNSSISVPLLRNLSESTKEASQEKASDYKLVDDLVNMSSEDLKSYDVIIIDESSALSEEQLALIKKNTSNLNNIRLIFMGDQSQASHETSEGRWLPVDLVMERTLPLTVSYRNSSIDINNIVDAYRAGVFFNKQVDHPNTKYNSDKTFGVEYYKDRANIIDRFKADIEENKQSILIVSNDNQRDKHIKELADAGINLSIAENSVYTVVPGKNSAQGLQFQKVYVTVYRGDFPANDVGVYNRMMLTAISRTGSNQEQYGYVGVYDENGTGKSTVGEPARSIGLEVDKDQFWSKISALSPMKQQSYDIIKENKKQDQQQH